MKIFFACIIVVLLCFALIVVSDTITPLSTEKQEVKVVEVAIFEGGYGIEWHQKMAKKFNELHKDRNIRIELWGDPRTADIIKPRLLRGNPPDLILDERLPLWLLIGADKMTPYAEALQETLPGGTESWESQFAPGMLDLFNSGGEVYAVPAAYGAWTCWYDAKLFRENGWTPPTTWDEFIQLCKSIKASGIAPIALQGKYASFYAWNTLVAIIQRVGGLEAINRINALDPNAFSHPDVIEATRLFQDLVVNYFQPGSMAMTHTESQLQFVNRNAAMIFCGIWLVNEMKEVVPADFEMRTFTIPVPTNGKGNPKLLHGQGMEFLFVPRDAKNPQEAFEFARFLLAPENATEMAQSIGVISPLEGATPIEDVRPSLQSVMRIIDQSEGIFNVRVYMLFPAWRSQVMNTAIGDLCRGEISPEEFGMALDEGLQKAVEETDLIIPDPIRFE
jgi:N-acetylglucosamine transport system substrate-binding protein